MSRAQITNSVLAGVADERAEQVIAQEPAPAGPMVLDAALLRFVSGGAPKGTWLEPGQNVLSDPTPRTAG